MIYYSYDPQILTKYPFLCVIFMAKTDSFFIRAEVTPDDTGNFLEIPIDLGAYVSALGKSVLRILNVEQEWVQASTGAIPGAAPFMNLNEAGYAAFQLTTQTKNNLVTLADKSVIAKGILFARNPDGSSNPPGQSYNDSHMPQHYSNGYLVAVETMYLGAQGDTSWAATSDLTCSVMIECTVESLSVAGAMALSLSQQ